MAKNQAIVVGINQYEFLQPLNYARRDAESMAQFLRNEAGFERVFLFSDNSPEVDGKSTRPSRSNLLRLFREKFQTPFMGDGDNFWFFFAGHGIRHADRDYLIPCDGDPQDIESTGISTNHLTERLRRCGADNVVMLLDACRNTGSRAGEGIGARTAEEARQTGVISIFACSPNQFSYEIESLQHGVFTYALLEGLGIRERCATVEKLNQYLGRRVPKILRDCALSARQTPYTIAEPMERSHLILMPRYASSVEISTLKNDAYQAEADQNWESAQRLWIRVFASTSGGDMVAVQALQRIALKKAEQKPISAQLQQSSVSLPSASSEARGQTQLVKPVPVSQIQTQKRVPTSTITQRKARSVPPPPEDQLNSEKNVDYQKLLDLLKVGNWKDADSETLNVMLKATGRAQRGELDYISEGWLREEDIRNFPCTDLQTIDQLWVKYSSGRFGFSVQKKIYLKCGGKLDGSYDQKAWEKFSDRVGWRHLSSDSELIFTLAADQGHLPRKWRLKGGRRIVALFSRLEACDL
jgi:uncharacterized caspase-like protein